MKKLIYFILLGSLAVILTGCTTDKTASTNVTPTPESENMNNPSSTPAPSIVSELKIETLTEGSGAESKNGDLLVVHYSGTLTNGTQFDSSYTRGVPFRFTLGAGMVIEGWDRGMLGMKVGEKRRLTIPSDLGYGSSSVGRIPANSTLIFEVELLSIE